MEKPVAEACLRNQEPIARVLRELLTEPAQVLEIGSGTGQHAVYLARAMPWLHWQPSELPGQLDGIRAWRDDAGLPNLAEPVALDMSQWPWPVAGPFDAVFTANTVHFVGWPLVDALLAGTARVLRPGGQFCVYGPFNENGRFTSPGNEALDHWLKQRDPDSGIKDRQDVVERAAAVGLVFQQEFAMPANNRILVFERDR